MQLKKINSTKLKKKFALQNHIKEQIKIWEKTIAICPTNERLIPLLLGFPGDLDSKESACSEDTKNSK